MTFLEWEIYYRYELEEAVETAKGLIETANGLLPHRELNALRVLVSLAEHVVDRGTLDEKTNKWKIND